MDLSKYKFSIPENLRELIQDPQVQMISATIAGLIILLITAFVFKFIRNRGKEQKVLEEISDEPSDEELPADSKPSEEIRSKENLTVKSVRELDDASWLKKLKSGLEKTRLQFNQSLGALFSGELNEETLEKVHESLYRADIGVETCDDLLEEIKKHRDQSLSWEQVKPIIKERVTKILSIEPKPFALENPPLVLLVVGVNGVGKTTTIGKLAAHFAASNQSVMLCAADTFRAAAIDQLNIWAERTDVPMIKHKPGSDPAAVVFDGIKAAKARNIDVLLIDTAGRLHNKEELMAELTKIKKIVKRETNQSNQQTLMVIDATTGQNAAQQVKAFNELVEIDGLVVTKLDGTAKGGSLIGICNKYQIPIRFVGVGEQVNDLRTFNGKDFVESLF